MTEIEKVITSLTLHGGSNPSEKGFCDEIVAWIERYREFAFLKDNLDGHITASMMITNPEHTRVLLMFHKKLQMWVQFWGHCDGEIDTLSVAIREFHEESGITVEPILVGGIFHVDVHDIPQYKATPKHKHYDIMYLGEISDTIEFARQEAEVDDIRWFDIDGIENTLWEKWMVSRIEKIKTL